MPQSTIKDYLRESHLFRQRAIIAGLLVILLLGVLLLRLFNLQVVNKPLYSTLSRDNRVKVLPLPPTRGLIFDRNGQILAQNLPTHSLEIVPEKAGDLEQTLRELSKLIPISEDDRKRFNRLRKQRRRFDSIPIRVRMSEQEVARFAVNQHRFPGVSIQAKLVRDYPLADRLAHVVGYVGRINEQELQRIDPSSYAGTSYIGKTGLEKTYETALHGQVGSQQVEVNARGRVIRILQSEPPVPGQDLYLSLDAELQRVAVEAFGEENGAAVAIDPRDGSVLAMVSKPGFDPNLFVDGISSKDYDSLKTSRRKPLFNRVLRGQYPPGSTIKPFLGLAGLEYGAVTFRQKKFCGGYYQLPNSSHKYRDWKKGGHGAVDMRTAVEQSCDVYYYDLANQLGVDRIHEFLSRFGFGQRSGIDIVGELPGLLPSREWKKRTRRASWYPGETLIFGIGQGYLLTTPLQLANATAALADNGLLRQPRLVQQIRSPGSAVRENLQPPVPKPIPKSRQENWDDIAYAMAQVVEGARGTARKLKSSDYRIAAKTGTAQVFTVKQDEEYDEELISKENRDHALFIAYAPVEKPRIAVMVIVENGGHGGSVAGPVAKAILDYHLLRKTP